MSAILDAMRGAVSKDKRRYQKNGFDLGHYFMTTGDVTPNIIAMGFPSESMEATYRNPMKEVLRFLDYYHKEHYKVYNLCSERGYDAQKFYGRVAQFPFDDHNAPAFELIGSFCKDVEGWLGSHPLNIAVIHCKAGKGRTGLMICAWLLFTREYKTPDEALDFYAAMRTENKKGVTIPSQIRYVRYFHVSLSQPVTTRTLLVQRVVFHTLPKAAQTSDVNFTIRVGKTLVFTYKQFVENNQLKDEPKIRRDGKKKKKYKREKKDLIHEEDEYDSEASGKDMAVAANRGISLVAREGEGIAIFECGGVPVRGDVKLDFERQGARMFGFWFNTFFVENLHIVINKGGLDKGNKDKHHKLYDEHFKVEVVFAELTQDAPRKFQSSHSTSSISFVSSSPASTPSTSTPCTNQAGSNVEPVTLGGSV